MTKLVVYKIVNKGTYEKDNQLKYFFEVEYRECPGCYSFLQVTNLIYESMSIGQLIAINNWRGLEDD